MNRFILVLALVSSPVSADWLDIHLTSRHLGADGYTKNDDFRAYNSNNYGLGLRASVSTHLQAMVGGYKNSYYKPTLYAGLSWHTSYSKTVAYALNVGFVTGYEPAITLFVRPVVSVGSQDVRVEIGLLPPDLTSENPVTVLTANLAFRF